MPTAEDHMPAVPGAEIVQESAVPSAEDVAVLSDNSTVSSSGQF